MHRLVLNLRACSQIECTTTLRSNSELTFRAAYGGSPNSDGPSSRSSIASFMGVEELGGLLEPLDGNQHQGETEEESEDHDLKA